MLTLNVPEIDLFNDETQTFTLIPAVVLELEHSLVSISKWESVWEKPFLAPEQKTSEETFSYIEQMCLTPNVPSEVFRNLSHDHMRQINVYIDAKMTATWFKEEAKRASREVVTAEIVYYWLVALNIPFECETWHFNRLITLIKVCNQKNSPPKKMSRREILNQNRQINAARRQQYGTSG